MKKNILIASLIAALVIVGTIKVVKADMSFEEMVAKYTAKFLVEDFKKELLREAPAEEDFFEIEDNSFGAIGTRQIEDYVPVVKYNQGLYTSLPIHMNDGTFMLRDNGATTSSSDILDLGGFGGTYSGSAVGAQYVWDGFGASYDFDLEDEVGNASSTHQFRWVMDDTASTSQEMSFEIYQKMDNAYTLSKVLDIDSGSWLFNLDTATSSTSDLLESARFTALHSSTVGHDGFGISIPFYIETDYIGGSVEHSTSTHEFRFVLDDTATTSIDSSFQIHQKLDAAYTLTNVFEIDSGDVIVDTDTLFVDISADKVGIGTTTPWADLSVEALTGTDSFVVGSSTATTFIVDKNNIVGIGTTSPSANTDLAIGGYNATSTIQMGKACFSFNDPHGTAIFYYPCTSSVGHADQECLGGWATSTTACY